MIVKIENVDRDIGFVKITDETGSVRIKVRFKEEEFPSEKRYAIIKDKIVGMVSFSFPDDINPALWEIECDDETEKGLFIAKTISHRFLYNLKCKFDWSFLGLTINFKDKNNEMGTILLSETFLMDNF